MPSKRNKNEARKAKERGGEKAKINVNTAVSLLTQKLYRSFAFRAFSNFAS